MIRKIIHLADVHIPNDCSARPYDEMLRKALVPIVKEAKGLGRDEVRIVVSGDVFHNKVKTTNEARTMFHNMLNYLNQVCVTYLIAGNHDMLERNRDRMDSINPTFEVKGAYRNIRYLDRELGFRSGYVIDDNVIFALWSMHDSFASPNVYGLRDAHPGKRIVGLYHGDVAGAVTDAGRMSDNGIDTDEFRDCDCVMAGHIHKYQTIRKNGVPIVYAGSLFQQNGGENTTGHGYVRWDMETMKYEHVEIPNDHLTYRFSISGYDDVDNDTEKLLNL